MNEAVDWWEMEQLIGPVAGVLALVLGVVTFFFALRSESHSNLARDLKLEKGRQEVLDRLGAWPWHARHLNAIRAINAFLDHERVLGPGSLLSGRVYLQCLRLAFVYPLALFALAWLFGGDGGIAGVTMLPEIDHFEGRAWRLALLVFATALFSLYLQKINAIILWTKQQLLTRLGYKAETTPPIILIIGGVVAVASAGAVAFAFAGAGAGAVAFAFAVAGAVAGAFAFAFAGAGAGAFAGAFAFAGAGAGAVAFAFAVAGAGAFAVAGAGAVAGAVAVAVAGAGAGAVAVAVAVAFAFAFAGAGAFAAVWSIFFILLPLVNAFADMLSLTATRWLLRRAAREHSGLKATLILSAELLADVVFALVCLALLALLLPNVIEIANLGLESLNVERIDWQTMIDTAQRNPLAGGLVTGMLVTTLLPTLGHLGYGAFAVFSAWSPSNREIRSLIKEGGDFTSKDIKRIAGALRWTWLWLLPAVSLSAIVLLGAVWIFFSSFAPFFGVTLEGLALWATQWAR